MTSERLVSDDAFVLHTYPYQETSLILEAFTRSHGRVSLVARGARRPRSSLRGLTQAFQPLRYSWFGKSELHTLAKAEWQGGQPLLRGAALLCGFYLNELLLKLTAKEDAHEQLFDDYRAALTQLAAPAAHAPLLRQFELKLLQALGYGLNLTHVADTGEPVHDARDYAFNLERGPLQASSDSEALQLRGKTLIDMAAGDYSDASTRQQSRRLMRLALGRHLNGQTLQTRQLLKDLQEL